MRSAAWILAGALAASACRPSAASPAPARDAGVDADVGRLDGAGLYKALCAPCHGADAKGYAADHAPSLVNPTFLASATDAFLRQSIDAGRPGTSMGAYGKARGGPLDDAALDRLVAYLRGQGGPARPLIATAPGDAAVGAKIYAATCFACHGDVTTRGEAVWLANGELLSVATDAFLRHAIVHGRPGTKMEPFADKLSAAEIDGVVSYVRGFQRGGRPEVVLLPPPTGKEPLVVNPKGKAPSFTLRADPCAKDEPGCTPDPRFVSVAQVGKALAAKQRMVIIDARPPSEWRRVHLPGAVSIPYHDLLRLDELAKDGTWIVAYCACPHHLSGIVVDELRRRGYAHSAVLDEGITEWHRRGLPVVAAPGVPRPPPEAPPPR
jgi:cytochrome c oxidase cbb3-type subunit III